MKKILLLLFFTFSMTACSTGIVETPKISVKDAKLSQLSFTDSTAVFTLAVENPNVFPIYLSGMDYGLKLNGYDVASGTNTDKVKISSGKTETLNVPIKISLANLVNMLPQFYRDRQVKYELDGKLKTPIINLPFHRTGGIGVSK